MLVNLQQLKTGSHSEEKTLALSHALDLSDVRYLGAMPYPHPIVVEGTARYRSGILSVEYTARTVQVGECARCLVSVETPVCHTAAHTILERAPKDHDDWNEYILAPDGILDVDELVTADMVCLLENVVLCDKQCLGICPKCGADKNRKPCSCVTGEPDPRFDVLRKQLMRES